VFTLLCVGISRDSVHKRRATSGRHIAIRKKRKFALGRPPAMTKMGSKKINPVRARGGNIKYRALRLEHGNFSWGSEAIAKKVRIVAVVYNASNNELVRTNTLVKNAIVQVDAQPFRQYYLTHYGVDISKHDDKATTKATSKTAPAKSAPAKPASSGKKKAAAKADAPEAEAKGKVYYLLFE
jgi:small subunit ribosomal protein S8e